MEDKERRRASGRASAAALFAVYALAVLALLFLRAPRGVGGWNLRPLRTIRVCCRILFDGGAWSEELRRYAWVNFPGNILLFVPLGLFLPRLFPRQRRFPLFLATAAAAVVIVEALQYLTSLGALDVDDLILNLAGASLGFLFQRHKNRAPKRPFSRFIIFHKIQ